MCTNVSVNSSLCFVSLCCSRAGLTLDCICYSGINPRPASHVGKIPPGQVPRYEQLRTHGYCGQHEDRTGVTAHYLPRRRATGPTGPTGTKASASHHLPISGLLYGIAWLIYPRWLSSGILGRRAFELAEKARFNRKTPHLQIMPERAHRR